ncbi:hypothetical protein [Fimbriiglobus ruber]|uniref:Zinc finger/thioredoxin putative domain-containing protein n=1 Tax=Fimbriiglobus ruber TaxID=1908690 RepID=A0A225DB23_9BACT|nr:hypothetical protein [Fimbriiglobus ruber]OWK38662.1 hypothetical protein FRUB_07782 [Fimbriiglobus ruber]
MPILRIACPECKTGMKSTKPEGFTLGDAITCPKCGVMFAVEAPPPVRAAAPVAARPVAAAPAKPKVVADDDDDDRPKKKTKARVADDDDDDRPKKKAKARVTDDDEDDDDRPRKKKKSKKDGGGYRTSPIRFIVLGILVIVMLVMGYFLYMKKQRENEANSLAPVGVSKTF